MGRAVECDACGGLAPQAKHLRLGDVSVPTNGEGSYSSWSDIDLCEGCCNKPLAEVLPLACLELAWPWDEPENEPTAVPPPP